MTLILDQHSWSAKLNGCRYYTLVLLYAALVAHHHAADARPEYSLRTGINRCTTCHYSPAGGGPRNLNGKYFGSAGFKLGKFSAQPYAGADIKYLYYKPDRHSEAAGGLSSMNGSVWAAIPLAESADVETRVVGEHNIGGFTSAGPRHLYLQYAPKDETKTSFLPQHFVLGRFIPPFGVMTDEHRTYVRMQTGSTWNNDVRMGLMVSANPFESLHYDLAAMNFNSGQGGGSGRPQAGQASQWAYLINLRWMPARWGYMLGFSASHYEDDPPAKATRSARSVYHGFSFHRWTGERVPVSVFLEYAEASNWNGTSFTSSYFINEAAYATSIANTKSEGWLAQVNWDVTQKIQLNYKYDNIILDREYPADAYQRHGFGLKHYFGPNMWFQMRYENAQASRPNEEAGTKVGGLNAFWTVVSIGI